jgi:Tfp pilus assembly protein PilO
MKPPLLLVMVTLVVAVTGFLGYNNIHAPHQTQVRVIQNQIAEEQATQTMQADVAALLDQVERYRKRLPQERDPAWLVTQVLPIADRHGLQFTSISRETPLDVGGITRLTISLQGTGSYHQVGAFVDELERSEMYLRVERLQLSPPVGDAPAETGAVSLAINTLYMAPAVNQPR